MISARHTKHGFLIFSSFQSKCTGCSHRCDHKQNRGPILKELLRYCEQTTVKGVARTVRPGRRWLRYTWVIAVLILLSISIFHVFNLIENFLEYGTTIYYEEKTLDLLQDPNNDSLPEITVCNIQPLSLRAVSNSVGIPSYKNYLDMLTNKFESDASFSEDLDSRLRTHRGYFQYIGEEDARVVGHGYEDIVVECNVILSEATVKKMLPCDGRVNVSLVQFPDLFNCYSLSVLTQSSEAVITGFSLVLHTGAASSEQFWHVGEPTLLSKGMLLSIHPPSSLPFMNIEADGLSTGKFYTTPFSVMRHERLPDPYGGCVRPQQSNYTHTSNTGSGYLRYTSMTCWSGCVEEAIANHCNCRDGDLAGVKFASYFHLPYCADAHAPSDILETRMLCAETYRDDYKTTCYFNCPSSCSEASYNARLSHFIWPHKDVANAFYDHYVRGRNIENIFGNITQLSNGECENLNESCSKYDKIVKRLQDNFLGLQIYLAEVKAFVVGTQPKIDPSQLFSQIGGALNLWSGISFIAVVELIELAINLIIARRQNNYMVNWDCNT